MGKCCLHASSFIFDQIIIKVDGNQDRHKSSLEFDFGPNQTTHFGVTCPWVMKISHFWTWISLKPVGQSWSNFICSIIRVGERLHKVLGQIDFGTLDSGEQSLPFGLLVQKLLSSVIWNQQHITEGTRSFCSHQKFVPWGLSAPCPRAIYMYLIMKKKLYKIRLQRDCFKLASNG